MTRRTVPYRTVLYYNIRNNIGTVPYNIDPYKSEKDRHVDRDTDRDRNRDRDGEIEREKGREKKAQI